MSVTQIPAWEGNWQSRLLLAVQDEGANSVTEYLDRFPCEPYVKVARRLPSQFVAVQLELAQFTEAKQSSRVREAAQDCLSRQICYHLKRGWGCGRHMEFNTAGVYADWLSDLEFRADRPDLRPLGQAVWQALLQQRPPEGWLPAGPDDPLLIAAFNTGWPV